MKTFTTILATSLVLTATCMADEGTLSVPVDGRDLVGYQAKPLSEPNGGEKFKGSNFVHPLKTPSGFTITAANPKNHHHHHFGLWWPWKYVVVEGGRKVLCWELQKGDGLIEAKEGKLTENGFTSRSVYTDRKAPGGPVTLIDETLNARVSDIVKEPATGYSLDLEIAHGLAGDKPLEVLKYRYSGFSIRCTEHYGVGFSHEVEFTASQWPTQLVPTSSGQDPLQDWLARPGPAGWPTQGYVLPRRARRHWLRPPGSAPPPFSADGNAPER